MILLHDSRIGAVPVHDNDERLLSLRNIHPDILVEEPRGAGGAAPAHFCYAREGVAERLKLAAEHLPDGYQLLIKGAYRPALPAGNAASADYATGGVVDVTLLFDGGEVDMGTPCGDVPAAGAYPACPDALAISEQARCNRALLAESMEAIDFTNYPPAWWHWSYGDSYWAYFHHCSAFYSDVEENRI